MRKMSWRLGGQDSDTDSSPQPKTFAKAEAYSTSAFNEVEERDSRSENSNTENPGLSDSVECDGINENGSELSLSFII
jgi:hypothetical protein